MKDDAEVGILGRKTAQNLELWDEILGRKIGGRKIDAHMRVRPSFCALCFCHLVLTVPIDDPGIEGLSEYRRRPIDAGTL